MKINFMQSHLTVITDTWVFIAFDLMRFFSPPLRHVAAHTSIITVIAMVRCSMFQERCSTFYGKRFNVVAFDENGKALSILYYYVILHTN